MPVPPIVLPAVSLHPSLVAWLANVNDHSARDLFGYILKHMAEMQGDVRDLKDGLYQRVPYYAERLRVDSKVDSKVDSRVDSKVDSSVGGRISALRQPAN